MGDRGVRRRQSRTLKLWRHSQAMPTAPHPGTPILDDAEWAIMRAGAWESLGAAATITTKRLLDSAEEATGFDRKRLAKAVDDLSVKELLLQLDNGVVQITPKAMHLLETRLLAGGEAR